MRCIPPEGVHNQTLPSRYIHQIQLFIPRALARVLFVCADQKASARNVLMGELRGVLYTVICRNNRSTFRCESRPPPAHVSRRRRLESGLAPVKGFGIDSGEMRAPRIAKYCNDVTLAEQSGQYVQYITKSTGNSRRCSGGTVRCSVSRACRLQVDSG